MKITFLGTGTSHGIPMIGCNCEVCRSTNPKNKRTRPSILVEINGKNILIDTAPDLRRQAIDNKIRKIDAVFFTHTHADHLNGLDDLRVFSSGDAPMPCFGTSQTLRRIETVFDYAFKNRHLGGGTPQLKSVEIDTQPFELFDAKIIPIKVLHGKMEVLGFRIGNFAYVTDCNFIPMESMMRLENLELLILDALRWHPKHPTHFTIPEAIDIVKLLQPKQTYFTHMTHQVEHEATNLMLPENIELAYDRQKLVIEKL